MPGKAYALDFPRKTKNGPKSWTDDIEPAIIGTFMDQGLEFIPDAVQRLFDGMQASLHDPHYLITLSEPDSGVARRLNLQSPSGNAAAGDRADGNDVSDEEGSESSEDNPDLKLPPGPYKPNMLGDSRYDEVWTRMLDGKSDGSEDLIDLMKMHRANLLCDHNKSYNDRTAMGCHSQQELIQRQQQILAQIVRKVNRMTVAAFDKALIIDGDASHEQEAMRAILRSQTMREVRFGNHFDCGQLTSLFKLWAVRAYVSVKYYYESLTEVANVNVVATILEVFQLPDDTNMREQIQRFQSAVYPIAKTFHTVDAFLEYLECSMEYEMIKRRSHARGPRGRAYGKGHDLLREELSAGKSISKSMLERALQLIEDHSRELSEKGSRDEQVSASKSFQAKTATGPADGSPGDEHLTTEQKELRLLKAQVANLQKASRERGDRYSLRGGRAGRGGRGGRGASNGEGRRNSTASSSSGATCEHCGRNHGNHPCLYQRDFAAERAKLERDEKLLKTLKKRDAESGDEANLARAADFDDNEDIDIFSCLTVRVYDPDNPDPAVHIPTSATVLHLTAEDLGACIDTGTQAWITNKPEWAKLLHKQRRVKGIAGAARTAEVAEVGFPSVTEDGTPILFQGTGAGLFMQEAHSNLLPLAPLIRAGVRPAFQAGSKWDPLHGGYLHLPTGQRVKLIFKDELWYLPTWSKNNRTPRTVLRTPSSPDASPVSINRFQILNTELDRDDVNMDVDMTPALPLRTTSDNDVSQLPEPGITDQQAKYIRMEHAARLEIERWCHPGKTKREQIMAAYPTRFPRSKAFRHTFLNYISPIDALVKGHRSYRKTARMKKKMAQSHQQVPQAEPDETGDIEVTYVADDHQDPSTLQSSYHSYLSTDGELHDDDVLKAFSSNLDTGEVDLHLDHAITIAVGLHGERYYLIMCVGGIDFLWATPCKPRKNPERLVEDFLRMTKLKVQFIRIDDAGELARSQAFQRYAASRNMVLCPAPGYTHTFQARAEGAVRICKSHVRCLLKAAHAPLRFWPFALLHFVRIFNWWPSGRLATCPWNRIGQHRFSINLANELHPWGCRVIAHLPREHPQVRDTTHSDRGVEGAYMGWSLTTHTVLLYSFKDRKVLRLSDPTFFDQDMPFKNPECLVNHQYLNAQQVADMIHTDRVQCDRLKETNYDDSDHSSDTVSDSEPSDNENSDSNDSGATTCPHSPQSTDQGETSQQQRVSFNPTGLSQPAAQSQRAPVLHPILRRSTRLTVHPSRDATMVSTDDQQSSAPRRSERLQSLSTPGPSTARETIMADRSPLPVRSNTSSPSWTSGAQIPHTANYSLLTDLQLAKALVHHGYVMTLPADWWTNPVTGKAQQCKIMAAKYEKFKGRVFLVCDFLDPVEMRQDGVRMQLPISPHSEEIFWSVRTFLQQSFSGQTLQDIGITPAATSAISAAIAQAWSSLLTASTGTFHPVEDHSETTSHDPTSVIPGPFDNDRDNLAWMASTQEQSDNCEPGIEGPGKPTARIKIIPRKGHRPVPRRVYSTTADTLDYDLLADLDSLTPDPQHIQQAYMHPRMGKFWKREASSEMNGLFDKNCFRIRRIDSLTDDERKNVFGSRLHCHIKRHAAGEKRGRIKRCKVRLVLQAQKMVKGSAFYDAFAPVPQASVARLMLSLAAANGYHLHSVDLEQAFIQGDWNCLPEGAPTIFIRPPTGWDGAEDDTVLELLRPLYGHPAAARALHYTINEFMQSEGFERAGFERSVWTRRAGGTYTQDILVSMHIDDSFIACEDLTTLAQFKQALLTRFKGEDQGEVTEYLGCEIIRDWDKRQILFRQSNYSRKIVQYFNITSTQRDPVSTPLETNKRLSKKDSPSAIDPKLQTRFQEILGYVSFLVQMTRPDLAFAFAHLSTFSSCPGAKHLAAAERVIEYLACTLDHGLHYSDPGVKLRNILTGWVDSDYAGCPDTRRSVTGYLLVMNNGPISWKSKRQPCVTLSSAEAEFVAASLCGKEVIYLRNTLRHMGFEQHGPTYIWEGNEACIKMSENPINPGASKHIDTRVYWLRDMVEAKHLKLKKIDTSDNVADAFTKTLPGPSFLKHREYMLGTHHPFQACYKRAFAHIPAAAAAA